MNYTVLSLSQSPPLSVPMPYFLAAPLFALAAGGVLGFAGPELLETRWSATMLALTHLFTVGFLGTVMLGAMQQLVPVLIGVPLPAQRAVAHGLFLLWLAGAVLLVAGMAGRWGWAVQGGGILLAVAVVIFVPLVARSLWRSASEHATGRAMALAIGALLVTLSLVLYLILRFGGLLPLAHPLTTLHIGWGSLGWLLLLLAGVAYQVVPMFQLTPEYPQLLRRWLAPVMWGLLVLWSAQRILAPLALVKWPLAAGVALFAVQTLLLQGRRRRRLADVTLDFWRLAMGSLLLALLLWVVNELWPAPRLELLVGVLFFVGFAASAFCGMLYKIVPFLVWLHLNNRLQQAGGRQGRVPNMKQVIPERQARRQLHLHLVALLLLVALFSGLPLPPMVAGLFWAANSALLLWNLLAALRLYARVVRAAV